jgi:CheY-like chemotaxis protein
VVLVPNGFEALKIASSLKPDLFVLDYHLPNMDGLELYERLHTTRGLEAIPTLFLTAYPFSLAIRGRKLISLKKPFEFDELLHVIHELLAHTL